MKTSAIDYAEFAEFDRRQRGIERHLLAAFLGGLAVGLTGMLTAGQWPGWLGQLYDPYAYLGLALAVGATASGFGWALLTTFLAAVSTLVAAMGGSALRGGLGAGLDFDVVGGSAAGLGWTLVQLVGLGLLAYVTRRDDRWGDHAAGAIGAALVAGAVGRAAPGYAGGEWSSWPLPILVVGVLAVSLTLVLRRSAAGRVRSLASAVVLAALFAAALAVSPAGWILPSA